MNEEQVDAKIEKMMNVILAKFSDMLNENTTRLAALVDSKLEENAKFYEHKFFKKSGASTGGGSDNGDITVVELSTQLDDEASDNNHVNVLDNIVESDSALESKMDSRVQTGSYNSNEVGDDLESRVTDRRVSNPKKVRTDTSERNPRTPGPIRRASKMVTDEIDEEAFGNIVSIT